MELGGEGCTGWRRRRVTGCQLTAPLQLGPPIMEDWLPMTGHWQPVTDRDGLLRSLPLEQQLQGMRGRTFALAELPRNRGGIQARDADQGL